MVSGTAWGKEHGEPGFRRETRGDKRLRKYREPCPVCNLDLPKGQAKIDRHYQKHPEIFAARRARRK